MKKKWHLMFWLVLFLFSCNSVPSMTAGLTLDSKDFGSNPIIFVHGYGGSSKSWSLIINRLPKGYDTFAIDLVGFGGNRPEPTFGFSLQEQAKYLANSLANTGNEYTIVAHSMGATVVVISMLDYGLKPKKVVFVDPLLLPQKLPFFIFSQTIPLFSAMASHIVPPSNQVDLVLKRIFYDFNKVNPELRREYIAEFEKPFHRYALRQTALELSQFDGKEYVARLGEIGVPVVIIWAKDDPLLPFSNSILLEDAIPNSRVVPIERCGHAPHEECPDHFIQALSRALED